MMDPRLTNKPGPLYEKVKQYIIERINSQEWGGDRRVPSEMELVERLGISRMTIHRALRELTAEGLLVRIQGVGTFVAEAKPQSALLEINDIAQEIAERGHVHSSNVIVLEQVSAEGEVAQHLGLSRHVPAFHSVIVHRENGIPVQLEERFVNPLIAPQYLDQDFSRISSYEYLFACSPATEVEHIIHAVSPDQTTQLLLDIPPSEPCLLMRRRTWCGALAATFNRLTYPGSRYSLGSRYGLPSRPRG